MLTIRGHEIDTMLFVWLKLPVKNRESERRREIEKERESDYQKSAVFVQLIGRDISPVTRIKRVTFNFVSETSLIFQSFWYFCLHTLYIIFVNKQIFLQKEWKGSNANKKSLTLHSKEFNEWKLTGSTLFVSLSLFLFFVSSVSFISSFDESDANFQMIVYNCLPLVCKSSCPDEIFVSIFPDHLSD